MARTLVLLIGAVAAGTIPAHVRAQSSWGVELRSPAGPIAVVQLPNVGKSRVAMISFEYTRKCQPIFSFAEFDGTSFGTPISQHRLPSAGGSVNGKSYSGPAVQTVYNNGYEIGFGIPQAMATTLFLESVRRLTFSTPSGQEIPVPSGGMKSALDAALAHCLNRSR